MRNPDQAPVSAHIIDKGTRSTLAQWTGQCGVQLQPLVYALCAELLKHSVLHADETPVAILKPRHGKDPSSLPVELAVEFQ